MRKHWQNCPFALITAVSFLFLITATACGGGGTSSSGSPVQPPTPPVVTPTTYTNPIVPKTTSGASVESCADPSIIYAQDKNWYAYCTGDPLNDTDKTSTGDWRFHLMPILRSSDLVTWSYVGDVLSGKPSWVAADGGLWAPAIKFFEGKYYLYYAASRTALPGGGSAIGVATSSSPAGPFVDVGAPVVEPGNRSTIDPEVIEDSGQKYIYFGSYAGGISVRKLSADGLHSDASTEQPIAIPNRYEGANILKHDGYYYLFVSSSNCCNGPLSGYNVFVGRSTNPLGPYLDRDGLSLLASRPGGSLVLGINGNKWVGPGHNAAFTDASGQDWMLYHAINRNQPYFAGATGFTKRPLMLDALDWTGGWPTVRGGNWASDTVQPKPAAQPGDTTAYKPSFRTDDVPGQLNATYTDEFDTATLASKWTWVRPPAATQFRLTGGALQFDTQAAELYEDSDSASVLLQPAPSGDYVVQASLRLNLPAEGCCQNYVQAGVVVYGDDDNYLKLVHASIWETRQVEFGKEMSPVPQGYPRYGSMFGEAPDDTVYLRIVKRMLGSDEAYTAYSSRDGYDWRRLGTWTHKLGSSARIGLISYGGSGFTAEFDYVRVYAVGK
ncbi:MAG TPA: family 43 glycosylhydrolase [Terriglobales bacterium]|nr:family 43 glycosylhydrolase [Terriglobales bacterium]